MFTKHFKYLCNSISYSFRDDFDIKHYLAQASASMGALRDFLIDPAVDTHSKYLIFCAIPLNWFGNAKAEPSENLISRNSRSFFIAA
mmetsp:Transcript_41579/g.81491  ORF Transcript_41579/g.81491 Transcript_41579/m.81491 type:complete len:87 (+) Transcript_41579:1437-1697(+)